MYDEPTIGAYNQNGFAVIPGLFSAEEMEEIARQLEAHLRLDVASAPRGDVIFEANAERSLRCLFRIHERSAYFDQLMRDCRLMQLVRQLFNGADVIADGTMLIDKAPTTTYEFPWHQDNAYQFWNPPDAVAVTLALDDSTSESGAVVCLAGSHRESILPHQPSGVFGASRGLVSDPSTEEYPPVTLSLKPGDVSLHHVNTIHRTGPNHTSRHRRNLGFAYHSSGSVCDNAAADQYKRDLEKFLQTQQAPK
ncbi:MAG: phytanoyl-CoA dioxygenase family protein [Acidobacteria bacterium]|nr:phytanoyl-CoA dioxygenase family protein [Acidobacteriota bacterium]